MLVHILFLYTTREILVRDMLGSGVISSNWQCYNENESLLWTINIRFYYSACARAKRIIIEGTGNGYERGKTPRGGRQGTPFNLPRCSSNLCHYRWNKR